MPQTEITKIAEKVDLVEEYLKRIKNNESLTLELRSAASELSNEIEGHRAELEAFSRSIKERPSLLSVANPRIWMIGAFYWTCRWAAFFMLCGAALALYFHYITSSFPLAVGFSIVSLAFCVLSIFSRKGFLGLGDLRLHVLMHSKKSTMSLLRIEQRAVELERISKLGSIENKGAFTCGSQYEKCVKLKQQPWVLCLMGYLICIAQEISPLHKKLK